MTKPYINKDMHSECSRWRANLIYFLHPKVKPLWISSFVDRSLNCSTSKSEVSNCGERMKETLWRERRSGVGQAERDVEKVGTRCRSDAAERGKRKVKKWMCLTEHLHVPESMRMTGRRRGLERYAMMILFLWQRSVAAWMCFICSGPALPG